MTEIEKPQSDGLRKWLIIDTILSVIFMLYLSSAILDHVMNTMFIATMIFIYWAFLLILWVGLFITTWVLKTKEKNTGSIIWSIITFVISVLYLVLGILIKYS